VGEVAAAVSVERGHEQGTVATALGHSDAISCELHPVEGQAVAELLAGILRVAPAALAQRRMPVRSVGIVSSSS
jgi:hypothetical protein